MKSLIKLTYFALLRPLEFYRKIKRKIVKKIIRVDNQRLNKILPWNSGTRIEKINGFKVKFDFDFSTSEKIYCYAYPNLKLTNVMKEFLCKGDTYIDIGANIGYFCALAMGHVGEIGKVYAFEPVNLYYKRLKELQKMNKKYNFFPINVALGEQKKDTEIIITRDIVGESSIGMNSILSNFRDESYVKDKQEIHVDLFDNQFSVESEDRIKLIKIDVEGYEYFVLRGMEKFLQEVKNDLLIFCEVTPDAYSSLNIDLKDIYVLMEKHGFEVIDGNSYSKLKKGKFSTIDVVFSNSREIQNEYKKLKYLYWNY